jgi:hypothetical protein
VTADFEVKPLIKEEKYKREFYPMSELRSHLAKSYFEDSQTIETTFAFPDGSRRNMPRKLLMELQTSLPVRATQYTSVGYHPDNFWYALYKNKIVWCESKSVTTERPQLNRYNALTLRKGGD